MTDKTNKLIHCYGYFTASLLFMFLILFLVVYFTSNSGFNEISQLLQHELNSQYGERYTISNSIQINLPISASSYCFYVDELEAEQPEIKPIVVAVRTVGITGPVICVFLRNSFGEVEYIGNIGLPEKYIENKWNQLPFLQIDYWKNNINTMLEEI